MKKQIFTAVFLILFLLIASEGWGQEISNYSYQLLTGERVKMEKGWKEAAVSQVFDSLTGNKNSNFSIVIKTAPVIAGNTSFVVMQGEKARKESFLKSGNYTLRVVHQLNNKGGRISFDIYPLKIQDKMETHLLVNLSDYGISITRKGRPSGGMGYYQTGVFAGGQQNGVSTYPYFYAPGNHSVKINPFETMGDYYGKIKPGTYDLLTLIELNMTGFTHRLWLENFRINGDSSYVIQWNLGAAEIRYIGNNYEVKQLILYPQGTAKQKTGKIQRRKELEVLAIERPSSFTFCPPGTYDVLLDFGSGSKFEWRENVKCKAGERTEVR